MLGFSLLEVVYPVLMAEFLAFFRNALQNQTDVSDDRNIRSHILADFGRVNIDMDDLRLLGNLIRLCHGSVADARAAEDHQIGVMYGVIDFYRAAREAGIKPILGCEVYVAPNSRFDKETTGGEERYNHLVKLKDLYADA